MISSGDVAAREPEQRTTVTPAGPSGGVDLISDLGDDVLARVLELVPDATELVRTAALSQRWRGLWTRVPALRFTSSARPDFKSSGGAERYVAFVNDALALRAAQTDPPALERLAISFTMERFNVSREQIEPLSVGAAQGWIHFAVEHALKSFELEMHRPCWMLHDLSKKKAVIMSLDSLPCSAKLETMRLALDKAVVRLPAAAAFVSLRSLSLESMVIINGTSHLLARLLSTACCPSLQKLRLRGLGLDLGGLEDRLMVIEAAALLELSLEQISLTTFLELDAPNLRVLNMQGCIMETLTISAPRLEELYLENQPDYIYVNGDLPCVWSLKAELESHGSSDEEEDNDENDGTMCLLHCCRSVKYLEVSLDVSERKNQIADIINGRIPHLPHVTYLTVHVSLLELHSLGAGISDILTQCSNLNYLQFHLHYPILMVDNLELDFFCRRYDCRSQEISLAHLQNVEFKGLAGTDCELWLMQSVLSSAKELAEVAISFNPDYQLMNNRRDVFDLMPKLKGGDWAPCSRAPYSSYKWTSYLVCE